MNRRQFLGGKPASHVRRHPASAQVVPPSNLAPYYPSAQKPWTAQRAGHLLRRTGFGPTWKELDAALKQTPAALVDAMFQNLEPQPVLSAPWPDREPFDESVELDVRSQFYNGWRRDTQFWWISLMLEPATKLREKMTLFWHGHFVSAFPKVEAPQYIYLQNRLLREYALGSFKELTRRVTIDPAMLLYLDGAGNTSGSANENYARELLELFTLGSGVYSDGTPHYTEQDIIQMARALTGWEVEGLNSRFHPDHFDSGPKTIFGVTANFGMDAGAEKNPIDLIFELHDPDHQCRRAAFFICSELYQFFVYEVPDTAIVTEMARTLEASDWSIAAVLQQLFTSEHFFDDAIIGGMLKSPVDLVVGALDQFSLQINYNPDPGGPETHDPLHAMETLSQVIFLPPSVKGWPGGRTGSAPRPFRCGCAT